MKGRSTSSGATKRSCSSRIVVAAFPESRSSHRRSLSTGKTKADVDSVPASARTSASDGFDTSISPASSGMKRSSASVQRGRGWRTRGRPPSSRSALLEVSNQRQEGDELAEALGRHLEALREEEEEDAEVAELDARLRRREHVEAVRAEQRAEDEVDEDRCGV